ncbi:DUF4936 family protein [Janthinobacterium fluminis]|uniref:DUF4936 family protein n=1 Tax=Janthinobacterium fluminis TaxID=2987524 RepID=A0ABT5JXS7_9BURK|nr:DUF4936 family protein [Janthinobacterium fluminis]MDC8756970.1 DUF4936 family protein [Janthinobacterium fluminis]
MTDLYIYYQVREENAAALRDIITALQTRLGAQHGVAAQLKRRPESKDGLQTWMEIYTATTAGFGASLDAAVRAAGVAELTAGARHSEVFTDLTPCA